MSLWQHKNIHKRHLLWLKLLSICLFFHCTVLLWFFFVYNNDCNDIVLSLNKNIDYSSPILFVPVSQQTTHAPITSVSIGVTEKIPEKIKETPAMTIKPVAVLPPPKIAVVTPVKKEESIKYEEPVQKKDIPTKAVGADAPTKSNTSKKMALAIQKNAHVSHNYKEVEILRRNALLQKELTSHWKPPVGMPANVTCEISFFVDNNGAVKNSTMVKSSGIVMYDISARQALFSMKMPQWTHGKTITINFT